MIALLAAMAAHACPPAQTPLYRVCIETVTTETALRWSVGASWPFVDVWTEELAVSTVRLLPNREPSWMWGRPLLNPDPPITSRFEVITPLAEGMPIAQGAVLYISAEVLASAPVDPTAERLRVSAGSCDGQLNILQMHGDQYELELCPELRQSLASR